MNEKLLTITLTRTALVLLITATVELLVIIALSANCRVAQERNRIYEDCMDKMVLVPKPPPQAPYDLKEHEK